MRISNANTRGSILAAVLLGAMLLAGLLGAAPPSLAQPRELGDWRQVSTPHFTVLTDAGAERGRQVALDLERFRPVFARLAPGLELRSPAPTRIVAFRDGESYAPYRPPSRGSGVVLGQFVARADGNFITLDAGETLVDATTVLQHEYVHYLVRHNFPRVPLWFHEGLAEYYSTFAVEGEVAVLGRPIERHRELLRGIGHLGLEEVLTAGGFEPNHGDGEVAGRFYAVSWALVHYLMAGDESRLDRTAELLLRLGEGEEPWRAAEAAFDLRIDDLEAAVAAHLERGVEPIAIPLRRLGAAPVATVRRAAPATVLTHLGDLLLWVGQRESARDHYLAALDRDPGFADAHGGLGRLAHAAGGTGQAEVYFGDAVALPGVGAATHLAYARLLLETATAAETPGRLVAARRQLELALALEPDFGEAWALRGASYLLGEVLPDERSAGIHALERAHALLPDRFDVAANLLRLHLRGAEVAAARDVLHRDLAGWAPAELVARLSEEIDRTELLLAAQEAFATDEVEEGLRLFDEAVGLTSDPQLRERMEIELRRLQEQAAG